MSEQQPSLRCGVPFAPHNSPEFQALCDALKRNDPTVTTVTTGRSTTPTEYGRRLGEALLSNNNAVVSELDLYLSFLVSEAERQGGTTTNSATQLLTWMEHSSSLQNVTMHARFGTLYDDRNEGISPNLLQRLLNAMKMNPNIRAFHSNINNLSLPVLTEYLLTPSTASRLQSLKIDTKSRVAREWGQAARAIAALSALKELSLTCRMEFLKHLPAHSTLLLRELHVDFRHVPHASVASDLAVFSSILSGSKDLQQVTIEWVFFNSEKWDLVRSGLQSNPSIIHVNLHMCQIARDVRSLIVNHMQSSSIVSHQNIRTLELSFTEINGISIIREDFVSPSRLAQMLCGSLLQHVTFDFRDLPEHVATEFFAVLSTNSSAVRLRSMHLKGHLLWNMSTYLSSTVHLRHFMFTFLPATRRDNDEFAVPPTFLHSLRRNGSLHSIEFKNGRGQLYTPSDYVSRFIQACTTRNRKVSDLMKSSFPDVGAEIIVSSGIDEAGTNHFPTQCLTSQQAPATAPNATLQGLLASLDTLGSTNTSGWPRHSEIFETCCMKSRDLVKCDLERRTGAPTGTAWLGKIFISSGVERGGV